MLRNKNIHIVVDFGGIYEDEWEMPVRAFTSCEAAESCANKREYRGNGAGLYDYAGSYCECIPLVYDAKKDGACCNVYDEQEMGNCDNGFECGEARRTRRAASAIVNNDGDIRCGGCGAYAMTVFYREGPKAIVFPRYCPACGAKLIQEEEYGNR